MQGHTPGRDRQRQPPGARSPQAADQEHGQRRGEEDDGEIAPQGYEIEPDPVQSSEQGEPQEVRVAFDTLARVVHQSVAALPLIDVAETDERVVAHPGAADGERHPDGDRDRAGDHPRPRPSRRCTVNASVLRGFVLRCGVTAGIAPCATHAA